MDRQILFILGAHTCVPSDPLQAARALGCRSLVLTPTQPTCAEDAELMDRVEVIHLSRPDEATELARKYHAEQPINAVVSYEDGASILAARIAAELGLLGHPVAAATAAVDKPAMKQRFTAAGVPTAQHLVADGEDDAAAFARRIGYPMVVKPCRGGASQGAMRADDEPGLRISYRRLRRIVRDYGLDNGGRPNRMQLVERYLPGSEISVELVVDRGRPQVTTVFEKPRPLTGPFFEETIYLTPARLPADVQANAEALAIEAVAALGLHHGPAHCEIRVSDDGLYVLEVAGRLLGGACARVFRDCLGADIHPLLLRLAMGEHRVGVLLRRAARATPHRDRVHADGSAAGRLRPLRRHRGGVGDRPAPAARRGAAAPIRVHARPSADLSRLPGVQLRAGLRRAAHSSQGDHRCRPRRHQMLFDEATSHLDAVTETVIHRNLSTLACTQILIAHRLSTVRDADLILVLHDGLLVENGTHAELLAHGGRYAALVAAQLNGHSDTASADSLTACSGATAAAIPHSDSTMERR